MSKESRKNCIYPDFCCLLYFCCFLFSRRLLFFCRPLFVRRWPLVPVSTIRTLSDKPLIPRRSAVLLECSNGIAKSVTPLYVCYTCGKLQSWQARQESDICIWIFFKLAMQYAKEGAAAAKQNSLLDSSCACLYIKGRCFDILNERSWSHGTMDDLLASQINAEIG